MLNRCLWQQLRNHSPQDLQKKVIHLQQIQFQYLLVNAQIKSPRSQMQSHVSIGTKNLNINQQKAPKQTNLTLQSNPVVDNYNEQIHTQRLRHIANENQQTQVEIAKIQYDFKHPKSTKVSPKRKSIIPLQYPQQQQQIYPASTSQSGNRQNTARISNNDHLTQFSTNLDQYNQYQSCENQAQLINSVSHNFANNPNGAPYKFENHTFEDPLSDNSISLQQSFANLIYPSKSKQIIAQQMSKEETFNPQQYQNQIINHQKSKSVLIGDVKNIDQQVHAQKVQQSQYKKQASVFNYSQRLKQLLSEEADQQKNRHMFSQQPSPTSKKQNIGPTYSKQSAKNSAEKYQISKIKKTFDEGSQGGQSFNNLMQNSNTNNRIQSSQYTIPQPISHTIDYNDLKFKASTSQNIQSQVMLKQQYDQAGKMQSKRPGFPIKNNYVIDIGGFNQSRESSKERQYSGVESNQAEKLPSREKKQHQPTQSKILQNKHISTSHQRSTSDYTGQQTQIRYGQAKNENSQDINSLMNITPTNIDKGNSFLKQYSQSFLDVSSNQQQLLNYENLINDNLKKMAQNSFILNPTIQQRSKERQNQSFIEQTNTQKNQLNQQAKSIYSQRKASYQPISTVLQNKKSPSKSSFIYKENSLKISQNNNKNSQKPHQQQQSYISHNVGMSKYKYSGSQSKASLIKPTANQNKSSIVTSPVGQGSTLTLNTSSIDNIQQQYSKKHTCKPNCGCKVPQHCQSTASLMLNHKRSKSDLQSTIMANLSKNSQYLQQHQAPFQHINQPMLHDSILHQQNYNHQQKSGERQRVTAQSAQITPRKQYQPQTKKSIINVSIDLFKAQCQQQQQQQQKHNLQSYNQEVPLARQSSKPINKPSMNVSNALDHHNSSIFQRKNSFINQSAGQNSPAKFQNSGGKKDSSLFLKHKHSQKYSAQVSPQKKNLFQLPGQKFTHQNTQSSNAIGMAANSNLISPVNHSSSFINIRQDSNSRILHNISYDNSKPKSQRYNNQQEIKQSNISTSKKDQQKSSSISTFKKSQPANAPVSSSTLEINRLLQQMNNSYHQNKQQIPHYGSKHQKEESSNTTELDRKLFMDIDFFLQQQNNQKINGEINNQLYKITEASMDQNYLETNGEQNSRRKQKGDNHLVKNKQQIVPKSFDPLLSQAYLTTDPNQSPLSKDLFKLKKVIKLNFKKFNEPPVTKSEFYRIGRVLGRGAFGKVNLAAHKLSEQLVAIKSINKEFLKSEKDQKAKIMQEFGILKQSCHPSVVRLYDSFETNQHICFVMELCSGGDLLTYVRKRRKLKEEVAKFFFKQLMEGLAYIHHSKLIVHRDIKLDNILLDSDGRIKIADFGVSRQVSSETERMHEQCGTPAYIAPEILKDKGYEGFKVDVWSAGVCLYAMLVGTVPFKAAGMHELHNLIITGKYDVKNENLSDAAKDLIVKLMCVDPKKRLNAYEVLSHPWLKDVKNELDIFTQKEKDLIKKEYLSKNINRQNRNRGDLSQNVQQQQQTNNNLDTEVVFTEHNLDTKTGGESFLKNASTKSIILAPFNSTISDFDEDNQYDWPEEIKNQLLHKKVIKFAAKCRDVNRQYEQNNNADLDNGVYNQFVNEQEKEDALQNDNKSRDNYNNSDASQGSLEKSFKETELSSDDEKANQQVEVAHEKQLQQQSDLKEFEQQIKLNYVKYQEPVEEIDEAVIDYMGFVLDVYPRDYLLLQLENKEMNYATAAYNLICKKQQQTTASMTIDLQDQMR